MYDNIRTIRGVGLNEIRKAAITAIREGRVQHEFRNVVDEKNLFLTGEVTPEQVIHMLNACKGGQHESSPHHAVKDVEVHIFKPELSLEKGAPKQKWYIKLYLLDPDIWFISVHEAQKGVSR